jgi:hypothetical protein
MGYPTEEVRVSHLGVLAARALGSSVCGVVVSVHRHAVNLRLDEGPVIGVLSEVRRLHPWSVVAALAEAALAVSTPVAGDRKALQIGPVTLVLEGAVIAELVITARPRALPPASLATLAARAEGATNGLPNALEAGLASFQTGGSPAPLASLVGLGEGLTPSADDVLVGVLAGLDLASDACPEATGVRRELVRALPGNLESRTPRVSAQALGAAIAGRYAAPLLDVLEVCGQPAAGSRLDTALSGLLDVGHRSGRDTLLGLLATFGWAQGLLRVAGPIHRMPPEDGGNRL